ncbi:hypothetical protein NC651_039790 [Populus alba x Populus x berolinensis]|nr:hypothetical protein NC651_039790 [Populus alba x Populus x berolinensis]
MLSLEAGRRRGWSGWFLVSVGRRLWFGQETEATGKKREGLSSFGQKTRGLTERGMREVMSRMVAVLAKQKGKLWLILGEAGFGRENLKAGGAATCYFIW